MSKPRSDYDKVTDSKRRYVMQGIRFPEPKATEIEKQIEVLANHHGKDGKPDKTAGILAAIKREYERIEKNKK